jgi:hypothetical protein
VRETTPAVAADPALAERLAAVESALAQPDDGGAADLALAGRLTAVETALAGLAGQTAKSLLPSPL